MKILSNFPYQKVLVLGLAKSGEAAAQLLLDSQVPFRINDLTKLEDNEIAQNSTLKVSKSLLVVILLRC